MLVSEFLCSAEAGQDVIFYTQLCMADYCPSIASNETEKSRLVSKFEINEMNHYKQNVKEW
jgi:hypothetical protein